MSLKTMISNFKVTSLQSVTSYFELSICHFKVRNTHFIRGRVTVDLYNPVLLREKIVAKALDLGLSGLVFKFTVLIKCF